MKGTTAILALTALVAPAALAAQEQAPTAQAAAVPTAVAAPVLDDAAILAVFDGANRRDLETATVAAERARNQEVRQLAVRFANEHMGLRRQGQALGTTLQVYPKREFDAPEMQKHAETMAWLKQVPADSFDGAWLDHEIAFHAAVLEGVQGTLLGATTKPELKALLEQSIPAFEAHLAAARDLKTRLDGAAKPEVPASEPSSAPGGEN